MQRTAMSPAQRLAEGVPVLAGISFGFLTPALERAFAALLPAVKAWFPAIVPELDGIEIARRHASLDLSQLAEEPSARQPQRPP